jgi:hypothetical protein
MFRLWSNLTTKMSVYRVDRRKNGPTGRVRSDEVEAAGCVESRRYQFCGGRVCPTTTINSLVALFRFYVYFIY